ncbi:MAG TPA: hypothetical protein VN915_14580 [Elusimicrobiota bacterium]|nr:hypothetical protein [Elusimicrobiota bacterium]
MKKIIALACLSAVAMPALAANVVVDAAAGQTSLRAVAPALPVLAPAASLSVTVLGASPIGAFAAPGIQAAALVPAQAAALVPAHAAFTPVAAAMEGPAQPAAAATGRVEALRPQSEAKISAMGSATGIAAGIERARAGGSVETALSRGFDQSAERTGDAAEPVLSRETAAGSVSDEGGLKPASPAAKTPASAPAEASPAVFTGTWRKVSGPGFDRVRVAASQNGVQVRYGASFQYGYNYSGVNAGTAHDAPWRGGVLAPGGLVTRETTTRFTGTKLEEISVRTETHWVRIPNRLVETRSLEVRDGRLIETSESTLYRKAFFYFGPYSVKTRINTTNLADPARPLTTTVYERETAAQNGAPASETAQVPPAPPAPGALARASAGLSAAGLAYAVPALAAAGQAPHHEAAAAALGAIAGFVAMGLVGWARRDKSSGGDFNFTPLFNAIRALIYGLGGAAAAAVAATAISRPAGLAFAFHPGAATLRAAIGAAAGFAAGAALGWARRDKNSGGDFGFGILFNGIKMLIFGLIGAVVGAVGAGLA